MLQVNLQLLGGRGAKSTKAAAVPPATKRQSLQTKATIAGVDGKEYRVEYGKNGRLALSKAAALLWGGRRYTHGRKTLPGMPSAWLPEGHAGAVLRGSCG
jgi:hypothetical protein